MKFVFRPGLRPRPRWGSSRRSPAPLIGWGGGNPLPIPHHSRRLRRLSLVAPANWGGVSPSFRGDGRPCLLLPRLVHKDVYLRIFPHLFALYD